MALTEREKAILRLKAEGASDYKIAHQLKMETPNVTRSRKNALKKIEHAQEMI
jgi:DNA-binding NarL/FixJ family response regulator